MTDFEQIAFDVLSAALTGVEIHVGVTQKYMQGAECICITQNDNSTHTVASGERDRIVRVGLQIQSFSRTPERRNETDRLIDSALSVLCLSRNAPNHFCDTLNDGTVIFRSVIQYGGKYDTTLRKFYMK